VSQSVHPVTGSPALPTAPQPLVVPDDLADDSAWRRYQAQHLAAQTLALQRTEWYAKSIRVSAMVLAFLAVAGLVLGLIFGIIAAGGDDPSPYGL
jgi:hypothetical protein